MCISEAYLEPIQASMIELFCENRFTIFQKKLNHIKKSSFIDVPGF